MLFMENETEIFVAWLIKHVKKDKRITGKKIAETVKCDPTTISSYIRKRTKPDYDVRVKILEATKVDYEEMLRVGRSELKVSTPTPQKTGTATTDVPEICFGNMPDKCVDCGSPIQLSDEADKRNVIVIKGFKNKERAIAINQDLVALEGLDEDELEEIQAVIAAKVAKLLKKKTENSMKTGTDK